jgi:hypothetical protein
VKNGSQSYVPGRIMSHRTRRERARPPLGVLRAPDEENQGRRFIISISLRHYTSHDRIEEKRGLE